MRLVLPAPSLGETVEQYRLLRLMGSGSAGQLFEVVDIRAGQKFALRWLSAMLTSSSSAFEHFRSEVHTASRLQHPNIVSIYALGNYRGHPYLISEFADPGESLAVRLARGTRLGTEASCQLVMQLLRGLSALHGLGLRHRDLRPETVFLQQRAEGEVPRVLDLALAQLAIEAEATSRLSASTGFMRGMRFTAPEALMGNVNLDPTVDIYSVGVLLYRMLTGSFPYRANNPVDLMLAVRHAPGSIREHRPELPERLAAVVARAIAPDRGERYLSADAFAVAIEPFTGGHRYYDQHNLRSTSAVVAPPKPASGLDLKARGRWKVMSKGVPAAEGESQSLELDSSGRLSTPVASRFCSRADPPASTRPGPPLARKRKRTAFAATLGVGITMLISVGTLIHHQENQHEGVRGDAAGPSPAAQPIAPVPRQDKIPPESTPPVDTGAQDWQQPSSAPQQPLQVQARDDAAKLPERPSVHTDGEGDGDVTSERRSHRKKKDKVPTGASMPAVAEPAPPAEAPPPPAEPRCVETRAGKVCLKHF